MSEAPALRPYQQDAIDRSMRALERGVRRQLGVAATGLGKSCVAANLGKRMGVPMLWLAHRDELVEQAAANVRKWWPGVGVGVVKAARNELDQPVVVASVQTLARQKRLEQMPQYGLVIADESHHFASGWRSVLDHFVEAQLILGVTATPDRGDGKGLDDLFDEIVWNYDILWGIRSGYLSELRATKVTLSEFNLADVKVRRGEYDQGQAGAAMSAAGGPAHIVAAWRRMAADRRTLVFTPTVALAHEVAEEFRSKGVAAAAVSGETPTDERRAILAAYSEGTIQVVANCAVLIEGYDEPRTDCIVMARPTRSRAFFTQCIGRGTRRHPDKTDCLVLDVVGGTDEHSLVTVPSLFGLDKGYAERLGDGTGALSEIMAERDEAEVRAGRLRAEEAELFRRVRQAGVVWVTVHDPGQARRYVRPLGKDKDTGEVLPTVVLAERPRGWTAGLQYADGTKRVLLAEVDLEMAQGVAEDAVRRLAPHAALVMADAPWRKRKPTKPQRLAAAKWKMPVDPAWTAGELSEALDEHIARIKAKREPVA